LNHDGTKNTKDETGQRSHCAFLLLVVLTSTLASRLDAVDCNRNGVEDNEDIQAATSEDCNDNQVPDECELARLRLGFAYEGLHLPPSPEEVVAADLNGDGRVDFAIASRDARQVSVVSVVISGEGGTLTAPVSYSTADRLSSITALDLDGDGDLDLATANSRSVEVLTNAGDGSFAPGFSMLVPDGTRLIRAGDITDDGAPDLIVANGRSHEVTVLSNVGGGSSFREGVGVIAGERPSSLAIADLDADGVLDAAVTHASSEDIVLLKNGGDGRFAVATRREFESDAFQVLAADFDADGIVDLAVGLGDSLRVFRGAGRDMTLADEVTLAIPSAVLIGADLDGDGDTDLVSGGQGNVREISTLINHGGVFGLVETRTIEFLFIASGDVDGDGDDDLGLVSVVPDNLAVLFSGEEGTFTLPLESSVLVATEPRKPHSIATGDFDGDGRPEVATSDGHDISVSLFRNVDGRLAHVGEVAFAEAGHLNSIVTNDIDGDGDLDLLVADREANRIGVLLNRGDGTYPAPVHYKVGQEPFMVTTGDFDGDGAPDMVAANKSANTITLYRNRRDGTFETRRDLAVGVQPLAVAAADLDGDGDVDLVTANQTSISLSILQNAGGGEFGPASEFPVLSAPRYVIAADLDEDGDQDLAVADSEVSVILNRGDGTFFSQQLLPVGGGGPYSVLAADVNADDRLDLAIVSEEKFTVAVLIGRGDGTFPLQFRYRLNEAPRFVGAIDLNADGLLDLIGTNRRARNLTVLTSQSSVETEPLDPETFCGASPGAKFVRGDTDAEGTRNLADVIGVLEFLFRDGAVPSCSKAADSNDDGRVNVLDPLLLLSFLFRDGAPLPEPAAGCGDDPTADELSCETFPACR
jgi:hypothetical protein